MPDKTQGGLLGALPGAQAGCGELSKISIKGGAKHRLKNSQSAILGPSHRFYQSGKKTQKGVHNET
jgi:hypothetical protein